ncbi:uncharacterized protein B0P05DRAFT_537577 [Gilbertella persicaria]|uniref:uncharacterized protein n=1 Tax=Gilbertella persicaria TaxID=101096 RepID=UPI00221F2B58|nr:uncharacterized protein B0P05DRAFT_537577 [Gilbertella persicaria]KAI8082578.1 hypothetical protein B0P05DRAFT_537577 [Gilbertella persicaria]
MSKTSNSTLWNDLLAWQEDINAKDNAASRRKLVHDQGLPPIRKSTEIMLEDTKPVGLQVLSLKKPTPHNTSLDLTTAEAEKAKGNDYFAKKDFKNAIACYGKAIDLDPTVPVYFVNRAMAYLKINSFLEAEKDCTRGLELQPKNVKALWRRGIALRELGRIEEARKDFEKGLAIEPNNKSILDELRKLPKEKPVKKVSFVEKEEKRRLPINVIDEAYPKSKNTPLIKPVVETKQPTKTIEPVEKKPIVEKKETIVPSKSTTPIKFTSPRTNFEFERDWKTYKARGDDVLYQYFQTIQPSSYVTLFKSSLESDQFEKMIDLLETKYTKEKSPQDIFYVLQGLSQVKRLDMLIMFLDKKSQQALQGLFELLKSNCDKTIVQEKLVKLSKVFNTRI